MNAHDLAPQLDQEPAEEDQRLEPELESGVCAAGELVILADAPAWSDQPPAALLPHDPLAFQQPPPLPAHEEVLRLVAEEALGRGLARRMF
jgi:hypothetical protein